MPCSTMASLVVFVSVLRPSTNARHICAFLSRHAPRPSTSSSSRLSVPTTRLTLSKSQTQKSLVRCRCVRLEVCQRSPLTLSLAPRRNLGWPLQDRQGGQPAQGRRVLVRRRQGLWHRERGAARPPRLLQEPLIGESARAVSCTG